jgi:beta-D-galactosyl-(1->4)-L-rhamnose phosphorylase
MNDSLYKKGSFTLPGEAGYEELTLKLAKKWGADVIRDSDGTKLSNEINKMGFDIYSTLCLVRSDNEWAKKNMDKLQQNYLMSFPKIADKNTLEIDILDGYFKEQFIINESSNPKEFWQVFDRTTGKEVPSENWSFNNNRILINNTVKWHKYTVNFLVHRIWEEISMYNHITNNWDDKEHLMSIDPIYEESQNHILELLENWLKSHPHTNVVRLTSMFYNFTWIWGSHKKLKYVYSDWASYDFTVNPLSLQKFEEVKGYKMTSEDFINMGYHNSTHNVPSYKYLDWIDFINSFVVEFGKKCIELIHKYNKKAYVFYDDHWVGVEPYSKRFKDFAFDGIIKCVFNGFEVRKCAGVKNVSTHELRLHPYLFPTGLKGEPTFKEGGKPDEDAKNFWVNIRRALLREPVERIGLGGYLHLTEKFPEFQDYIEELAIEFRQIKYFHENDEVYKMPFKIGILNSWGKLRTWICSGHLHEHPEIQLTNILESLSGLPFDVEFLNFDEIVREGIPKDVKVIINAGSLNSAWSGGENWLNTDLIELLTKWVATGGSFIGVGEPSAIESKGSFFQLSHILGLEKETGSKIAFSKYEYEILENHFIKDNLDFEINLGDNNHNVFINNPDTKVLSTINSKINLAINNFFEGRSAYLSDFKYSLENTRLLHKIIIWCSKNEDISNKWICTNIKTECAYYKNKKVIVVINNSSKKEHTNVLNDKTTFNVELNPYDMKIIQI